MVRRYFEYLDRTEPLVDRLFATGVASWVVFGDHDEVGLTTEERRALENSAQVTLATTTYLNSLCRVRWRKDSGFRLVALQDVRRLTGLEPAEVLRQTGTQELTRIDERGVREQVVRLPIELLIDEPEG